MKIKINRAAMLDALKTCAAVAPARSPRPSVTCVKLSSADKHVAMVVTDYDMHLRMTLMQVEIIEPGEVLIPLQKFCEIVSALDDDVVSLASIKDTETVTLTASDSNFRLFGPPLQDFPPVTIPESNGGPSLQSEMLCRLIDRTGFAAAKEMTRYAINGILMELLGKKVTLVATDGHRVAVAHAAVEKPFEQKMSAVLSNKMIRTVRRCLHDGDVVKFHLDHNRATCFICPGPDSPPAVVVSGSLIEGNFPPYGEVIPKDHGIKYLMKRLALLSVLQQAGVFTSVESKGMRFDYQKEHVEISTRTPDAGEAKVRMPVELAAGGGGVLIGFNPDYVREFVKAADGEQISVELATGHRAGLFRAGPDYLYVVMPLSLN
jgi:DNA polymerase-3 subunit beta